MPYTRLTLRGGLASLRSESPAKGQSESSAVVGWQGPPLRSVAWVVAGAVIGLAGCATVSPSSSAEQKQKVVAERAQARWELLLKGDVASAYQFLSAGSKAAMPVEQYKAKIKPGMWRQVKVGKVDCAAELCKVVMQVTYDAKHMKGIETPVDETWIIENGSAWYVYR